VTDIIVCTRVSVRDLPVLADIGIHAHEIGQRQPLIISVTLTVEQVEEDRIEATTDYRLIAGAAEALAETRIALIEVFAQRLASYCLRLPGVRSAEVMIDKPQALPAGMASVTTMLSREIAPDIKEENSLWAIGQEN
jgi:dihydroneopterin aldolase